MNELFNVKDKVVVITGGAGILGKGIAAYLAKEGAKVVVLDRSEEAGKALENRIKLEAKSIAEKYVSVPQTTEYAILFLPTEGLYAEV